MGQPENALTKTYDLMVWLFPQIGKFPRDYRFILGDRIENGLLDVCEMLIVAQYSKKKAETLRMVNLKLETLRHLIRLSKDLKLIGLKKYEYLAREIDAIGRCVGGWLKAVTKVS